MLPNKIYALLLIVMITISFTHTHYPAQPSPSYTPELKRERNIAAALGGYLVVSGLAVATTEYSNYISLASMVPFSVATPFIIRAAKAQCQIWRDA